VEAPAADGLPPILDAAGAIISSLTLFVQRQHSLKITEIIGFFYILIGEVWVGRKNLHDLVD
jgi:hypothetical protein